jgi:glycosyltransferase involved in cell wall biosynthesis
MLTVVYCTRKSNPKHQEHLIKTSGLNKHIEIIEIINNGEDLTKSYNRGLKQAKNNIVVFCHDDITFETKNWGNKLIKLFESNPEYGIIGVAGTKYLSQSGRWWENPRKMYGRVQHTHEGKTWLSSYSADLGQNLEEVVLVDGLFFSVDKSKIKKTFNEDVKGFHFYDVNFCFENYIENVKVGVTTVIRVNHQSIGMTNEQWEVNRVEFSEKFKDKLPVNIKRILRKDEKLKVLIGCLSFTNYTGSELYVFELAKALVKQNCDVTICSTIGNPLANMAKRYGIKLAPINEPPGFKLGDGKWELTSPQGKVVSQPNTLYKLSDVNFDVLHLNHKPITEHILRLYPNTPVICSIHSELINLEEPVKSEQIKKYIAIRPEIKEYISDKFDINEDMINVVYNPIDATRFKPVNTNQKRDKKRILFVGTIDYLRKQTIEDLIITTKENNQELWIVGKKNDTYLDDLIIGQNHVSYFEPTFTVEKYIQDCDETAGILLGRTTIEGWLCGKSGWIYDIDSYGNIKSKELHNVPNDIDKFKSENVSKEIIELYKNILD